MKDLAAGIEWDGDNFLKLSRLVTTMNLCKLDSTVVGLRLRHVLVCNRYTLWQMDHKVSSVHSYTKWKRDTILCQASRGLTAIAGLSCCYYYYYRDIYRGVLFCTNVYDTSYRAMHFSAKRGISIACRLSVRLSVCDVGELW